MESSHIPKCNCTVCDEITNITQFIGKEFQTARQENVKANFCILNSNCSRAMIFIAVAHCIQHPGSRSYTGVCLGATNGGVVGCSAVADVEGLSGGGASPVNLKVFLAIHRRKVRICFFRK